MSQITYISVILPLKLEWEPCYSLPADASKAAVGNRVKVIFANKPYTGVISAVGITPETELSKIKQIKGIETELEPILPEEIELWRRVAEYYMCTIGEVYKAAYPIAKINLEEARAEAMAKARERKAKLLESMTAKAERIKARMLRKQELIESTKPGTKTRTRYEDELEKIKLELATAEKAIALATGTPNMKAQTNQTGTTTPKVTLDPTISLDPTTDTPAQLFPEINLSETQELAYKEIKQGFQAGKPVMLHGVTGSGKTEIYIKLAQETIYKGRNVLYLVPEIALSRQLEERLFGHFGDMLMTFHSGETAASKRNTAETIRSYRQTGENYITLGTRSSLFLPHHNIGLIIVDEEHDSSYKQDSPAPRYNGRDTALMASVIHKSDIILGSATPSLEELYNCECGKHALVQLTERYHGSDNSDIEIIDTKAERRKRGMVGNFSRKLIDHIRRTLSEGGQVMVLRSRRAWASALQCEECGDIKKCPHCNVSLSYHKTGSTDTMVCHYCGYKAAYTGTCSKCNGPLKSLGAGTQKIEEEAATLFPEARIARLDSDTAQSKTFETKTIKAFSKGEIDILIGTQMLGKGFDFSNLRLVAVIAADSMLGLQDFRADEKALQLLEQFRGRCGRRESKGMFAIQTSQPEHPIYQHITNNHANIFNTSLLEERNMFGFPPYTRMVEITVRDLYEDRAERMANALARSLKSDISNGTITGPYAPAVSKVADNHLRAIRISLPKDSRLKSGKHAIMHAIRSFEKTNRYDGHVTVNVDPA